VRTVIQVGTLHPRLMFLDHKTLFSQTLAFCFSLPYEISSIRTIKKARELLIIVTLSPLLLMIPIISLIHR